jgi:hypothetical protein
MMCTVFLVVGILSLFAPTSLALGGANPNVTLPLHVKVSTFEPCSGYLPVDCLNSHLTTQAPPNSTVTVFLLAWNYFQIAGIQTAFDWDASWSLNFGLWDCQAGQLSAVVPMNPGGPTAGALATVFNCINGPALAVIGRMSMQTGPVGCISQVNSSYPGGILVLDCQGQTDTIPGHQGHRLGSICVQTQGVDACQVQVPVEESSWGRIKGTYR